MEVPRTRSLERLRYEPTGTPCNKWRCAHAFSLLEILVAVSLLVVIITALLAMFQQTQRAFRSGLNQSDVLESGRAAVALIAQRLQEMTPSQLTTGLNFYVGSTPNNACTNWQTLPDGSARINVVQEFFLLSRYNDDWRTAKFSYCDEEWDSCAAVLYLKDGVTNSLVQNAGFLLRAATNDWTGFCTNVDARFHRILDGVVHLRLLAYSAAGQLITNEPPDILVQGDGVPPYEFFHYEFYNQSLPAFVDIELGVLERRTLEQFNAMYSANLTKANRFLANQAGKVHLFRQRVPIRTEPRINP